MGRSRLSLPLLLCSRPFLPTGALFVAKHFDMSAAETVLKIYGKRHAELIKGFGACSLPRKDSYIKSIKKVKDSACSPDGVPYPAHSADLEWSGTILENISNKLAEENDVTQLDLELLLTVNWFGLLRKE